MLDMVLIGLMVFFGLMALGTALFTVTGPWRRVRRVHRLLVSVLTYTPPLASVQAWSLEDLALAERWALAERGRGRKRDMPFCVVALGYERAVQRGLVRPDDPADLDASAIRPRTTVIGTTGAVRAHG